MGNNSIKSSKKTISKTTKNKHLLCCLCSSNKKSSPIFERIDRKQTSYYRQSIEDCKKSSIHDLSIELIIESNREFINLINKYQLNFYLKDYLNRLKTSKINQTFQTYFSSLSLKIIYPCNSIQQYLTDDLNIFLIYPPESILPNLSKNTVNQSLKIHEQIRAKCYFIPLTNNQIEPNDDEYKQKHFPISLESSSSSYLFISNDSFQTGYIRIKQEKISKEFLPFIIHSSNDNFSYLSSNLIQKWFYTLIFVNQTCSIVKRFLFGDKHHMTCLFKNQENSAFSFDNNLIFAALRHPSYKSSYDKQSDKLIDGFSPLFLSNNEKYSNDYIYIDYEQYSFALILSRWPKIFIENYYTNSFRYSNRRWPSNEQMNIIINKSLLLIPDYLNDQWKINFDFIEKYLFELMNESTLFFYLLCQQLFSQTYSKRILIKHCFLNYCEIYDLPFSKNKNDLKKLINHFLKYLSEQLNKNFLPNYFNHQINLLQSNEDYNQWFDYITKCFNHQIYLSTNFLLNSTHSIIIEYLFYFNNQLYEIFHRNQSKFYLNDSILLDLHKNLSNHDLLIEKQTIENIQNNLIYDFEINAELVHICLNQIRKSQTSLIFHYIWTIFIQYLHTYYNVLWNL